MITSERCEGRGCCSCNRRRIAFSQSEDVVRNFRQKWSEDDCVRLWYVLYKVLVTLYFWGSLIYTWADTNSGSKYLIYMTNWGICFINFTILLEAVIVTLLYFGLTVSEKLMTVSWCFCYLFYNAAVFITLLYWTMLYESGSPSYINLYVHGLQGLFVLVDTLMSNRQWHIEKIWTCLPFGLAYVTFNLIYWAAGGTDPFGNHFVYDVIDWGNHPGDAVVTLTIGVVVCPVIHTFIWMVSVARDWTHWKLFPTTTLTVHASGQGGVRNTAFIA